MLNLLQFTADIPEPDLRQAIVEVGQIADQRGLLTANDGNISVRLLMATFHYSCWIMQRSSYP